jgi:hypothetical protein
MGFWIGSIDHLHVVTTNKPVTVAEWSKACILSSLGRKPGSWVLIQHKAWIFGMCMCLFCVCVVVCFGRRLATK